MADRWFNNYNKLTDISRKKTLIKLVCINMFINKACITSLIDSGRVFCLWRDCLISFQGKRKMGRGSRRRWGGGGEGGDGEEEGKEELGRGSRRVM